MPISDMLKARRAELDLTLEDVAKIVGVTRATIQKYENGIISNIPSDKIEALAKALKTTPSYLMGWDNDLPDNILPMPHSRRVPRLGQIACGTPITAEENFDGYDEVPDWVHCDFTLTCKGDSMINARIYDGDIVCIRRQDTVETGEIAAVLVDNDATLKRVHLFEDHIVLEAENPTFRPLVYWGTDMANVHIIGKATHFISTIK